MSSPPGRLYAERDASEDRFRLVWQQDNQPAEHSLLDPGQWSADGHLSLGQWWVSPDGNWVAYQMRVRNADSATLRIVRVDSGQVDDSQDIQGAEFTA